MEKSIAMKEIVMDSDQTYLPLEIITNILKRLPAKSLIRFQCVCKDWKNLVKTPSFIEEHLHHSTVQNPCLLFQRINPRRLCLINRDMQVLEYQISPFTDPLMCRFFPSSNNGLVCLQLRKCNTFCVWNPATREVHHVDRPLSLDGGGFSSIGFGFSPIVNDYKIVSLLFSMSSYLEPHKVEVFSLSTRSWKKVEVVGKLAGVIPTIHQCGFTLDGAIFWFGHGISECSVVSFDIATEAFTLIPFTGSARKSNFNKLTAYENKLALLSQNSIINMDSTSIDLWVMEKCIDASGETCIWTKIYTSNRYPCPYLHPVSMWGNEIVCKVNEMRASMRGGKCVFQDEDEARLVFCNLHTNEFKEFSKCSRGTPIWSYAESLISDPAEMGLGQNGIGGST